MMAKLGLLPTDPRALQMTDLQWLVMAKFCDLKEQQELRVNKNMLSYVLGLSGEGGKFTPLSFFLSPDAPKHFAPPPSLDEEDALMDEQEALLSEDTTQQLEDSFNTDISGFISEDELKKVQSLDLAELLEMEKQAGIKIMDGKK